MLPCGLSHPSWFLCLLASFPVLFLFQSLVYMEYLVDSLLHFFVFLQTEYVLAEHFLYSRERFLSSFSRSLYEQGINHREECTHCPFDG